MSLFPPSAADAGSSLWYAAAATVRRDLTIAFRKRHDLLNPFFFFVVVASLFPIGISPEPERLSLIAAGVVWITALLATMLSLDSLFRNDYEDGALEQLLLCGHSLYFLVLAKHVAHWLVSGLPIAIASPVIAYALNLPADSYLTLFVTLVLGTPALSLLGGVGVALTVGLGSRGLILAVLTLPLCVPVLIAGTVAVQQAQTGLPAAPFIALMGAMSLAALCLAPLAAAASLRISVH